MIGDLVFPFTSKRFVHVLLERTGDVCLIERTNERTGSVHWEVVVLEHEREHTSPRGEIIPAHLRYPSSEQWGEAGWTYTTRHDAERRYSALASPAAVQPREGVG